MRTVVVTVARQRLGDSRLTPEVARRIEATLADPIWLLRANDRRESWVSRSGLVRIDVVSNEPPATGPLIARYPSGNAAAWVGHIDDPAFVADDPAPAAVAELPGIFALVAATDAAADGYTCVHNADSLYLAEGRDVTVVSSSARAAQAVAGITDTRPPTEALIGLTGAGRMISEVTPFAGVTALPPDSHSAVRPAGVAVAPLPGADIDPDAPAEEAVEAFIEALLTAARAVGRLGSVVKSQLTGGRDSRLAAAALAAAGVPFVTSTNGIPTDPDVMLAARVAAALGVEHGLNQGADEVAGGGVSLRPVQRAFHVLRACEGMANCFDEAAVDGTFRPSDVTVGGQCGELLRGGLALGLHLTPGREALEARSRLHWRLAPNRGFLAPPARDRLDQILAPWEAQFDHDVHGAALLMDFVVWTGRWHAVLRSGRTIEGYRREFLIDNQLVRIARAVNQHQAAQERLVHAAIHRLAPQLCQIPFVGSRWVFEEERPSSICTPELWSRRAPVPALRGSGWEWRAKYPPALQQHFKETIMAAPLFDGVLDRDATATFLDEAMLPSRTYMGAKMSWALYTAAHLVEGLADRPVEPEGPLFEFTRPDAV